MFTRKQYMNSECTHRMYYAQFVAPATILAVGRRIGFARLKASTDPHFNDIPLAEWDALLQVNRHREVADRLKAADDFLSMATSVCILKEAARQIVEHGFPTQEGE